MDCHEVKKSLQEYMDNELNREMKNAIKLHLSSCDSCRSEYHDLVEYRNGMNSLGQVRAPDDFLSQIHERIEKPSLLSKIKQKLFFPLNIKLPLEAAGVLATVVIIVFLYNPMGSLKWPRHHPVKEMAEMAHDIEDKKTAGEPLLRPEERPAMRRAKVGSSAKLAARKAQPSVVEKEEVSHFKSKAKRSLGIDTGQITYEIALLLNTQIPDILSSEAGSAQLDMGVPESSMPYDEEEKMIEDAVKRDSNKKDFLDDRRYEIAKEKNELKSLYGARASKPVPPVGANGYAPMDYADSIRAIDDIARRLGGKIIEKRYRSGTKLLEYIMIDVPVLKYHTFIAELKKLGEFQKKAPSDPAKNQKTQQLKINLIQP